MSAARWKATLLPLGLKLAVSGILLALLLSRIGVRSLFEAMGRASAAPLVAAVGLLLLSHALGCWQWGRLLRAAEVTLPAPRLVAFYFAGTFLNLVLPGSFGGDLARILGVAQASGRGAAVVGATVVERLLGGAALGLVAALALVGARPLMAAGSGLLAGAVIAYAVVSIAALALVLGPGARRLLLAAGRLAPAGGAPRLARLSSSLARLGGAGRASFIVAALAIQSARILAHAQVARSLDIDVELRYFFLFVPLLAAGVALPISIGGIGVRETLGAMLFGLLGVDAAEASAMQLLAYLVAAAVSLPGAMLLLLRTGPLSRSEAPGARP